MSHSPRSTCLPPRTCAVNCSNYGPKRRCRRRPSSSLLITSKRLFCSPTASSFSAATPATSAPISKCSLSILVIENRSPSPISSITSIRCSRGPRSFPRRPTRPPASRFATSARCTTRCCPTRVPGESQVCSNSSLTKAPRRHLPPRRRSRFRNRRLAPHR